MKKLVALLMAVMMLVPLFALAENTDDGKVLNIYCWNDEFKTRFEDHFAAKGLVPEGVTVNFVTTPSKDNAYQNALDAALLGQADASADDKVDLFLVEADYALKYANSDVSLDVYGDVGLTQDDTAQMYQYTKDMLTSTDGKLKGVSWQACPAGMIYRRSIAKDILGTDDPAKVQEAVADWDKFVATAEAAKAKGYFMTAGAEDFYRAFSDSMANPWVVDNKIQKPAEVEKWVAMGKDFADKGYDYNARLWSPEQGAGAAKDGKVFTYFGPAWYIDFCLANWTLADANAAAAVGNGSWGDWAFTQGPQAFSWGGSWLCAAAGTDNMSLVKQIMYTLTCDKDTLVEICKSKNDFTNNIAAMTEIASSDFSSAFLGGQNYIGAMLDNAQKIDRSSVSPYDQTCTEHIQTAMNDYFVGTVDLDTAWNNFYTAVQEIHPELTH